MWNTWLPLIFTVCSWIVITVNSNRIAKRSERREIYSSIITTTDKLSNSAREFWSGNKELDYFQEQIFVAELNLIERRTVYLCEKLEANSPLFASKLALLRHAITMDTEPDRITDKLDDIINKHLDFTEYLSDMYDNHI